ncbi:hypothetical protein [Streptomyces sp. NPDC054962]
MLVEVPLKSSRMTVRGSPVADLEVRASDGILDRVAAQPPPVNWAMHFGQAALLGVLRSLMSQAGELTGLVRKIVRKPLPSDTAHARPLKCPAARP